MGAGQSTASQAPPRALHVLRVTPSSPASQTTIEPFFDFVVGFQGDNFAPNNTVDAAQLEKIVEGHEGRTLNLLVWNSKSQETRVVPIVPSRDWSLPHSNIPDPKEPEAEAKPSLLGLSMRMCEPELALDNVWHVLDVLEGSPAESAGLVPYGDWIIGWSGGVLSAEGDFYEVVESHIEKPLRVYVYSFDFDTIREVVLVPNWHWGGEGLLGCVFGFGLLHRIPPLPPDREPGSIPPELLEDVDEYEEQQLFVPADYHGESEYTEHSEDDWQHEEWMRQSYASSYDRDPSIEISSAYSSGRELETEQPSPPAEDPQPVEETQGSRDGNSPGPSQSSASDSASEHEHWAPSIPVVQVTPVRASAFVVPRSGTPTPSQVLGSFHMNGIGISPRTASWDGRPRVFDLANREMAHRAAEGGRDGDSDGDDVDSVTDTNVTETTEMDSEVTSQAGSLTSID
ncbi:uncharacterized protein FIBRA_04565 [Fibroporia radiculosa]|uniref:PDZ GRASP-type domain-containing protein n=1 Tax=Fibroporia radiculosa TaxID=599839 RepID=J4IA84_9APHY|nr:uncharacterized protein FIBRA_04565 [Fibroporia radiculosa]CCM02466.1 predicted protein [Fibroporia radiculosa]